MTHCQPKVLVPWLVVIVSVLGGVQAQVNESAHDYTYTYLGLFDIPENLTYVACLDSAGCNSIIYAPPQCKGCFDPACASSVQVFSNVSHGEAFSFYHVDTFIAGSVICSTGQVNAVSEGRFLREWTAFNKRGTQFGYVGTPLRIEPGRCGLFASEEAIAFVGAEQIPFTVEPWTYKPVRGLSVRAETVIITSESPILVACWRGIFGNDFASLVPMTDQTIYGFDSRETLFIEASCNTNQIVNDTPACEFVSQESFLFEVGVTLNPSGEYFDIEGIEGLFYSGEPHRCRTTPGNCGAMFTVADGGGFDKTVAVPEKYFTRSFVAAPIIQTISFGGLSRMEVECTLYRPAFGNQTAATTVIAGYYGRFAYGFDIIPPGSILTCDQDVFIIADALISKEFNMYGEESAAAWEGHLANSLTSSPSPAPTAPTATTAAPTSIGFLQQGFFAITGALGGVICVFALAIFFIKRKEPTRYTTEVVLFPDDEGSMVETMESSFVPSSGVITQAREATVSEELLGVDVKTANSRTLMAEQARLHRNSTDEKVLTVVTDDML